MAHTVNYLGTGTRGIHWKQFFNFKASLGVLNPLAVPIKSTCFWGLLVLCGFTQYALGQQKSLYSGNHKIQDYQGRAEYTYQVIGIDTIFDGPFKMERSNLEALLEKNDRSFLFAGDFDMGLPQGDWLFQFGDFYTDSTTNVSGYQYRVNVNGLLQVAQGQLNQGKPKGTWQFSEKKIKNSEVQDTLFFSEVNFLDGIPQQSFTIENVQGTLIGRLLRNGLAHDTWSLFTHEAENTENWSFKNGWLENIKILEGGVFLSIPLFNTPSMNSRSMDLDQGYSTLISIYANIAGETFDASKGINALLVQNSTNYKKIDGILSALGSTKFFTGFKVKVPHFPLDSMAQKQLNATVQLVNNAREMSTAFLENTRLNLMRRSDEEADSLYQTVAAIENTFLWPLKALVELKELGIIESLDQDMLFNHLFPRGTPFSLSQSTIPDIEDRTQKSLIQNYTSFDPKTKGMSGYLAMARYVYDKLVQIDKTLGEKLEDAKQRQEFVLLEEQMIARANDLNQFLDSIRQVGHTELRALDNITATAEQLLSEYAEMPTGSEKLNQAQLLINCLQHFKSLSNHIALLPTKSKELDEKYTDAVFNPFTATLMDESVKKRLTSAYKNQLLPYVLEKVEHDLNCENTENVQLLLEKLHQRMVELRDEDTSKLERKLRKERDPKGILQLFNLKPLEEQ